VGRDNGHVTNRLATATSPYLLQHKDNPVDWWPWCDEAFAQAKRRDVPVFLSIGYAACHWCHVMAHESFEDPGTAALLNRDYVSIKVDREERPDVDAVYMAALQGLTGHGGWPMSVFLNHHQQPFHAGTYYPLEARSGMPAFKQVLAAVSDAWVTRRSEMDEGAQKIAGALAAGQLVRDVGPAQGAITPARLDEALSIGLQRLAHDFDPVNSGFGGAPKFPPSPVLEFLIRHARRTGAREAINMAAETCEAMARGGIYDQLGGGFARYSVDAKWVVPHFEKMLYDNAQLLGVYVRLYASTGMPLARRVCTETAEFLLRDLRTAQGGFASALDADAPERPGGHAHEGLSYVWTADQLVAVLGVDDGRRAAEIFGVTDAGTFEAGTSVLRLPESEHSVDSATPDADFTEWFTSVRAKLLAARNERPQPARDDKVVAAWNGLAIAALAQAGELLDRPDWIAAAIECADLLIDVHVTKASRSQYRLARVSRDGKVAANAPGVLEDYGDVSGGLLTLFAVTGDDQWRKAAGRLLETVLTSFARPEGGFYDTADDEESLIVRPCDPTDLAAASGWSSATDALLTYGTLMASERHLRAADGGLQIADQLARNSPRFAGWLLATAEAFLDGPAQVVIVGDPGDSATQELRRAAVAMQRPGMKVITGAAQKRAKSGPFVDRPMVNKAPTAYICRGTYCHPPVQTQQAVSALLES
jgi:uncharacterized protein YyaL (SSP411 family)